MEQNQKPLKVVILGDAAVGKTSLVKSYADDKFPEEHVATILDCHKTNINVDGNVYKVHIWDTAGQAQYKRIRALGYKDADVFLLCFSIDNRESLKHAQNEWITELMKETSAPIILVGNKIDLRTDEEFKSESPLITTEEGREAA